MEYALLFIAGVIFTNGIPHFVNGISGKKFYLPPRGIKIGSATVNVLWGWFNFVLASGLVAIALEWNTKTIVHASSILSGLLVCALILAKTFGNQKKTN